MRFLIVSCLWLLQAVVSPCWGGKVAFVIGIDAYGNLSRDMQLERAVPDARAVSNVLGKIGFDVVRGENTNRSQFNALWQQFLDKVNQGDTVALYFSGHGIEIDGQNFLLPSDVPNIRSGRQEQLKREALSLNEFLLDLRTKRTQVSLVVIDACRNNPFATPESRSAGGGQGLAGIKEPPEGMFIMYSAGAGETALDRLPGNDTATQNSVYTRRLIPLLTQPGLSLPEMARQLRSDVYQLAQTAQHVQRPAYYDGLIGRYCLTTCEKPQVASLDVDGANAADTAAWGVANDAKSITGYRTYIQDQPRGTHIPTAVARMLELEAQAQQQTAAELDRKRADADARARKAEDDAARSAQRERDAADARVKDVETRAAKAAADEAARLRAEADALKLRTAEEIARIAKLERDAADARVKEAEAAASKSASLQTEQMRKEREDLARKLDEQTQQRAKGEQRAADRLAWTKAQTSNRIEAYRLYLGEQRDGAWRGDAERELRKLEGLRDAWVPLAQSRNIPKLQDFAEQAKGTEYGALAAARSAELSAIERRDWAAAQDQRRLAEYESFLGTWPEGTWAETARQRIAELKAIRDEWQKLKAVNDEPKLDAFVAKHGWSEFGAAATDQLVALRRERTAPDKGTVRTLTFDEVVKLIDGKGLKISRTGETLRFASTMMPPYRALLGRDFIKKTMRQEDVASEGAFKWEAGKWDAGKGNATKAFEGLAGVIRSRVDKTGSVFLLQMHGNERAGRDVDQRDRQYRTMQIVEDAFGLVCITTGWHSILSQKDPEKLPERCVSEGG
jgi:uncharacterized caspase-like protein